MGCSCADGWSTTVLAFRKGLVWKQAVDADRPLLESFVSTGGSGNGSIDRFAQQELLPNAQQRYTNTSLLLKDGVVVGYVSNAMATVPLTSSDMMERNMTCRDDVPVLFLHRLGVHRQHHRKGVARILVWRTFETLGHACTHSAAAAVVLMVNSDNAPAKSLYASMGFEKVEYKGRKIGNKDLYLTQYQSAMNSLDALARSLA